MLIHSTRICQEGSTSTKKFTCTTSISRRAAPSSSSASLSPSPASTSRHQAPRETTSCLPLTTRTHPPEGPPFTPSSVARLRSPSRRRRGRTRATRGTSSSTSAQAISPRAVEQRRFGLADALRRTSIDRGKVTSLQATCLYSTSHHRYPQRVQPCTSRSFRLARIAFRRR